MEILYQTITLRGQKILSVLGTIGLTAISTTSLISCKKPNNSENGSNKPYPQQPPKNSKWKLNEYSISPDNKCYIAIVKKKKTDNFSIIKFNFSNESVWSVGAPYHIINGTLYIVNSFYQWQNNNEPTRPTVNKDTGEITDWKE